MDVRRAPASSVSKPCILCSIVTAAGTGVEAAAFAEGGVDVEIEDWDDSMPINLRLMSLSPPNTLRAILSPSLSGTSVLASSTPEPSPLPAGGVMRSITRPELIISRTSAVTTSPETRAIGLPSGLANTTTLSPLPTTMLSTLMFTRSPPLQINGQRNALLKAYILSSTT